MVLAAFTGFFSHIHWYFKDCLFFMRCLRIKHILTMIWIQRTTAKDSFLWLTELKTSLWTSTHLIHVQYCQLDSIGKNRSCSRPICSIWRIKKFSIRQLHLISGSDPLKVCRFSPFVQFCELKILFTTYHVEFRFIRFNEWKILRWIRHILFSIRKLHLISENEQVWDRKSVV